MKKISIEQLNAILQTIYNTNIPVAQFDAIKKLFSELPDVVKVEEKVEVKEDNKVTKK